MFRSFHGMGEQPPKKTIGKESLSVAQQARNEAIEKLQQALKTVHPDPKVQKARIEALITLLANQMEAEHGGPIDIPEDALQFSGSANDSQIGG